MKKLLLLLAIGAVLVVLMGRPFHARHGFRPARILREAVPYAKHLKAPRTRRSTSRSELHTVRPGADGAIDLETLMRGLSLLRELLGDNGTSLLTGLLTLPDEANAPAARRPGKNRSLRPSENSDTGILSILRNFKTDENLALLRDLFQIPTPPAEKPAGRGNRSRR